MKLHAWWLLGMLVVAGCSLAPTTSSAPTVADATDASAAGMLDQSGTNPRALGDPNAPIKMYEFSDYQ